MASHPPSLRSHGLLYLNILLCSFFCISVTHSMSDPFPAIFNFGDSLSDTGNLKRINVSSVLRLVNRFPYGETSFNYPTGRFSDGRVIIDFVVEAFGYPYLPPYLACPDDTDFQSGVNFAVGGATAINTAFFTDRNISLFVNNSLFDQLQWFETLKPSLCDTEQDCNEYLSESLFVLGEVGGNDYNLPLIQGVSLEKVLQFVPKVIETISSAAKVLIGHGAKKMVVPNLIPLGCSALYLTLFSRPNETDFDPLNGCLKRYNDMVMYHNKLLKEAVKQLQMEHPQVQFVYNDWYGSSIRLYNSPRSFGFLNTFRACCGGKGPYNFNPNIWCSAPGFNLCSDPSEYIDWDGIHLTEAAYHQIANGVIYGSYSMPSLFSLIEV
ncbi:GDSL esterase/lipase [Acorus gramineus]|uniref:GDSL esterase/lipase n=1 Tax=Acorus gramineus TaxID=55184 RepID=A0AAV9AUD8_ACOGR|nr:GDSL esterase/lipase [Acorus gramineus]